METVDNGTVRTCSACQCPAPTTTTECAFCGTAFATPSAVTFTLERSKEGFGWFTSGTLVASAALVDGSWQLLDARNDHVVTLVSLAGHDGMALVGPEASLIGAIRPHDDQSAPGAMVAAVATDPDGETVLVLRTDGANAAHLVDARGDVVALASWEDKHATTDLLVTPLGIRHSLAMVFGLLLSLELTRRVGDTV